ncbi:MAG: 2,3-bisphosphoglycerate-independent phosphoglycerate mutase [Microgenomates bacterium OLB22]|nr:MAG: 2,3-bisphosphoglycerate-independent phosphoglycerate mutase [Microgenomates bacterium OLB22]
MKPVLLIVLDGFGIGPPGPGNAIAGADPAYLKQLVGQFPSTQLRASGEDVGLPAGESGNTEVGHINMGAGMIVYQSLPRINMSIADGSFFSNEVLLKSIHSAKQTGRVVHLVGLVGSQHVHASVDHLYALLRLCKQQEVEKVAIHVITDGRDSPPQTSAQYLAKLDEVIRSLGVGRICSIMGRYYGMDRDRRWSRTQKAYDMLTKGSQQPAASWQEVVSKSYEQKIYDEFILPTSLRLDDGSIITVQDGDSVIFFNFRIDRPRQLTKAFVLPDFEARGNETGYDPFATKYLRKHILQETDTSSTEPLFRRQVILRNLSFVTMTEYERDLPVDVAFPPHIVKNPLGKVLSEKGISQLRIAESEKERFVTYYFNGLREQPFPREDRLIVPSPAVATYDLEPQMSAPGITKAIVQALYKQHYRFILTNFANADMVGHTGNISAAKAAIKTLDICLSHIIPAALKLNYLVLITADHGNAEEMIDKSTGEVRTEHTDNPVPLLVIAQELQGHPVTLQGGILADIAPTILSAMEISKPYEMTGRNLLSEVAAYFQKGSGMI